MVESVCSGRVSWPARAGGPWAELAPGPERGGATGGGRLERRRAEIDDDKTSRKEYGFGIPCRYAKATGKYVFGAGMREAYCPNIGGIACTRGVRICTRYRYL